MQPALPKGSLVSVQETSRPPLWWTFFFHPSEVSLRITVNGETEEITEGLTLLDFIIGLGLDPGVVVAELNRDIVARDNFAAVRLNPGDSLELLHFVGGG